MLLGGPKLPANATAQPPGPLAEQYALKNRSAAPVSCSDWVGQVTPRNLLPILVQLVKLSSPENTQEEAARRSGDDADRYPPDALKARHDPTRGRPNQSHVGRHDE